MPGSGASGPDSAYRTESEPFLRPRSATISSEIALSGNWRAWSSERWRGLRLAASVALERVKWISPCPQHRRACGSLREGFVWKTAQSYRGLTIRSPSYATRTTPWFEWARPAVSDAGRGQQGLATRVARASYVFPERGQRGQWPNSSLTVASARWSQ